MKSWTWKNAVSFIFYTFPSLLIFLHFRRTHIRFFLAPFFPQLLYYLVIACPVLLWFCFYSPSISYLCFFILLLHPVASYYTALVLQKDCLLQTLACPSLYLSLFPQSWSSEDPRNLTDLWNTALLRSCQSCLTVVDWNSKTRGRRGKSKKKKKLLRLMFVKQFLCVKAKNCLCNVKIGSQKDSFLLCWCMLHWWHVRPC